MIDDPRSDFADPTHVTAWQWRRRFIEPLEPRVLLSFDDASGVEPHGSADDDAEPPPLTIAARYERPIPPRDPDKPAEAGPPDFRFEASEGRGYAIRVEVLGGTYSIDVQLTDADGRVLLEDYAHENEPKTVPWVAPMTGMYYLTMFAYEPSRAGVTVNEYFGTGVEAAPVEGGVSFGSVAAGGDLDRYRLDALAGVGYAIDLTPEGWTDGSSDGPLVWLRDERGSVLASSAFVTPWTGSLAMHWTPATSGSYFLEVGAHGAAVDYALHVGGAEDDQRGQPAAWDGSASVLTGRLDHTNDDDYFRFTAEAGAIYKFSGSEAAGVRVLNPDGSIAVPIPRRKRKHDFPWSYSTYRWEETFRPTVGGEYLLAAGNDPWAWDQLGAADLPRGFVLRASVVRPGAPPASAPALVAGTTTGGAIESAGGSRWYRFDAEDDASYDFTLTSRGLGDGLLRLVRSDGRGQLAFSDLAGEGPLAHVNWVAPERGTYYLLVSGFDAGGYELTMTEAQDDQRGQPVPLAVPGRVGGRSDYGGDVDAFEFRAAAGKTYRITNSLDRTYMMCLWFGTEQVMSYEEHEGLEGDAISFTADRSGTYRVTWDGGYLGEDEYWIQVREVEDDQDARPRDLERGGTAVGTIDFAFDRDHYRFDARADATYVIRADFDQLRDRQPSRLRIVAEDSGEVLAELPAWDEVVWNRAEAAGPDKLLWTAPADGTYLIEVTDDTRGRFVLTYWERGSDSTPDEVEEPDRSDDDLDIGDKADDDSRSEDEGEAIGAGSTTAADRAFNGGDDDGYGDDDEWFGVAEWWEGDADGWFSDEEDEHFASTEDPLLE